MVIWTKYSVLLTICLFSTLSLKQKVVHKGSFENISVKDIKKSSNTNDLDHKFEL